MTNYVIYDAESGIVTGFSEDIQEAEDDCFYDGSNDVTFTNTEFCYAELEDIPRYVTAYNYKYSPEDGFSRIKNAQEILNERKAMINTATIRMEKMQEAIEKSQEAIETVKEQETENTGILQSIADIEEALCELSELL